MRSCARSDHVHSTTHSKLCCWPKVKRFTFMNSRLSCRILFSSAPRLMDDASAISICSSAAEASLMAGRLAIACYVGMHHFEHGCTPSWVDLGWGSLPNPQIQTSSLHTCHSSLFSILWRGRRRVYLHQKTSRMPTARITATSSFWQDRVENECTLDKPDSKPTPFMAIALPRHTGVLLDSFDASMAQQMSVWLCKHGRVRL